MNRWLIISAMRSRCLFTGIGMWWYWAAAAHVPAWKGEEGSGIPQPGTLMFEIDGVDDQGYTERPEYPVKVYRMPKEGRYKVNHYHVFNVDAADSKSMTAGHIEGRKQILDAFRVLHDKTPGFENIRIARTPSVRKTGKVVGNFLVEVAEAYYIPYRSMVPLDCDNLLVSGKTISSQSRRRAVFG